MDGRDTTHGPLNKEAVRNKLDQLSVREGACIVLDKKAMANGYHSIYVDGRFVYAHRAAWEVNFGRIPDGFYVCHRCDNRRCINPNHLFLGTPFDNARDMVKKGRSAKGPDHSQAKLTLGDVSDIRGAGIVGRWSQREIATWFGVNRSCVQKILNGSRWRR